jgi:S-DNA-T family DNA segregation ATPase FtsK/SpoIIIE
VIKQNRSGNNGITSLISIEDIWKVFPKNLPPLSFAVGIGEGGRVFYKDLDDCPHLLDVGGTGNGKSNLINSIICTYLWRGLTKDQVQFVLFDCKQGMELSFYEDIPHLYKDEQIPTGIIEEFDDAIPAMYHLLDVMKKRMVTIREAKCKSMNDYNMTRRGRNRMPSLVIVFDDYVNLSLSFGNRADDVITKISNQGRAAGIYIILGAQYPKSERFPSIALVNFSVIVAFLMKPGGSRSILGDNSAAGLSCIGRAIFQDRNNENEVQTPFISKDIIKACVLGAKTGTKPLQASKIDFEEILAYALEHQEGFVSSTKLYPFFKGLIGRNKLQTLITNADEQVYDVKGTLYKITGYPRKMIIADGSVIDPIADVEQS